ncbi:endonuclease/exonuclease/phosphatase family protein [Aeromonas schubertii]|uniref:endonuclease/exonuclease/phosphatase family protein n=1 Tax=Aeromonas schubertii TaxID=652 RepID=UPI000A9980DC|nr:endonuclease/exonuclease/phosphatase family protein [Aeromonas schubertii]
MRVFSLKFGWWNVGLSPTAKSAVTKACAETYNQLCTHITDLFSDHSIDLLGLCEVSEDDILYLESFFSNQNISTFGMTSQIGRSRFDLAVMYNNTKISVSHVDSLVDVHCGNYIKAGQVLKINVNENENVNNDNDEIYVYLCHWPSRVRPEGEAKRSLAAEYVYNDAVRRMRQGKDIIVMGDFNDNPYDDSLSLRLRANRCHDYVKKYPTELFYNPFWRTVVSDSKFCYADSNNTYRSGTHKYHQFGGSLWHSYDQICVSGSFIGAGKWYLNEHATTVIASQNILDDYNNSNNFIDHLPIACEITRP